MSRTFHKQIGQCAYLRAVMLSLCTVAKAYLRRQSKVLSRLLTSKQQAASKLGTIQSICLPSSPAWRSFRLVVLVTCSQCHQMTDLCSSSLNHCTSKGNSALLSQRIIWHYLWGIFTYLGGCTVCVQVGMACLLQSWVSLQWKLARLLFKL